MNCNPAQARGHVTRLLHTMTPWPGTDMGPPGSPHHGHTLWPRPPRPRLHPLVLGILQEQQQRHRGPQQGGEDERWGLDIYNRCRIKNKFCKFNYLNTAVIRATATLILQNISRELRTVRITLGGLQSCRHYHWIFCKSTKILNVYSWSCEYKPQPQVYQIVNF